MLVRAKIVFGKEDQGSSLVGSSLKVLCSASFDLTPSIP